MKTVIFNELQAKMDPKRVARASNKARQIMAGMFLTEMRRRTGVTQTALAKRLGVRQPTVAKMEQQDDLQLSTLQRIADALGVELTLAANIRGDSLRLPLKHSRPRKAA